MRIRTSVERSANREPGRELIGRLLAKQEFVDNTAAVIRSRLRIDNSTVLDETPLLELLSQQSNRQQTRRNHKSRRSAWRVKSSSFIGRLYSSFSYLRTVRLLRVTSYTSVKRAVQIPLI